MLVVSITLSALAFHRVSQIFFPTLGIRLCLKLIHILVFRIIYSQTNSEELETLKNFNQNLFLRLDLFLESEFNTIL